MPGTVISRGSLAIFEKEMEVFMDCSPYRPCRREGNKAIVNKCFIEAVAVASRMRKATVLIPSALVRPCL